MQQPWPAQRRPRCSSAGALPPKYKPHFLPRLSVDPAGTGRGGPKSAGCGIIKCLLTLLLTATEARASLAGEGLSPSGLRKHRGHAQISAYIKRSFSEKRAFRRARKRAQQSLEGGTTYREWWYTKAALQAPRGCPNPNSLPREIASQNWAPRPSRQPLLRRLSWNTSGLSRILCLA